MDKYRYLVFTNPVDGQDEEYNRWYDTIHLGEVVALPGFIAAERYAFQPTEGSESSHRYLAIYEFEADDPVPVLADLRLRADDGRLNMPPVLADDIRTQLYKVITPRVTR